MQKKLDKAECNWENFDIKGPSGLTCTKLFAEVQLKMKDIYPYDLFRLPESYYNKDTKAGPLSPKARLDTGEPRLTQASTVSKFWSLMEETGLSSYGQINSVDAYMNSPALLRTLNIKEGAEWAECSRIKYSKNETAT